MKLITGGCFCGQVRYAIRSASFHATLCHCMDCRRIAGAPVVAWFTVRPAAFAILAGTPKTFESSRGVTRGFCADCGTPLTYQRADLPDEIDVTTASLDDPERVPPEDETHTAARLRWMGTLGRLPAFPKVRDSSSETR